MSALQQEVKHIDKAKALYATGMPSFGRQNCSTEIDVIEPRQGLVGRPYAASLGASSVLVLDWKTLTREL